jgi:hypothetical protein
VTEMECFGKHSHNEKISLLLSNLASEIDDETLFPTIMLLTIDSTLIKSQSAGKLVPSGAILSIPWHASGQYFIAGGER